MNSLEDQEEFIYYNLIKDIPWVDDRDRGDITECYLDDFFSNPEPEIEYLQDIISQKGSPDSQGLFEVLTRIKYSDMMHFYVTRLIRWATRGDMDPVSRLLLLRIIFIVMVSEDPAIQHVISYQLKEDHKNYRKLTFFEKEFLPFLKALVDVFVNFSYEEDNIYACFVITVSYVHMVWRSQASAPCRLTTSHEAALKAEQRKREKEIQRQKDDKGQKRGPKRKKKET
jgi:hypothetical protein